jgi:hypothetical protein
MIPATSVIGRPSIAVMIATGRLDSTATSQTTPSAIVAAMRISPGRTTPVTMPTPPAAQQRSAIGHGRFYCGKQRGESMFGHVFGNRRIVERVHRRKQ